MPRTPSSPRSRTSSYRKCRSSKSASATGAIRRRQNARTRSRHLSSSAVNRCSASRSREAGTGRTPPVSGALPTMPGVTDIRSYLPVVVSHRAPEPLREGERLSTGIRAAAQALAVGGDAGERLPDGELVHLTGALVRQHRFEVAGVPQHRVLQRDAGSAEHGAAGTGDLDRFAHVVELAQADLRRVNGSGVLELAEVQREQEPLVELERAVGELRLGELEAGDGAIELDAGSGVRECCLQAVSGCAHRA